ncbi:hypothetical protein B0H34DRAFT_721546 [Crassisporium funariophilum]|nr:hypothetical protein B0H34DRAFT_721546 [Crassisporium funariophilum]
MSTSPKTAFISGPIDCKPDYFSLYYQEKIITAISKEDSFVLAGASGIDRIALRFLIGRRLPPSKITMYLTKSERLELESLVKWLENQGGNIKVEGETTTDRNTAMTRDSHYDILRCMTVPEQREYYGNKYRARITPEELNERRRKGLPLGMFKSTVDTFVDDKPRKDREKPQSRRSALFEFLTEACRAIC